LLEPLIAEVHISCTASSWSTADATTSVLFTGYQAQTARGHLSDTVSDHLQEFLGQHLKYRPVKTCKTPYTASLTSVLEEQKILFIVGSRKL